MTAPETRWTAETEQIIALAFARALYVSDGDDPGDADRDWDDLGEDEREFVRTAMRPVLVALATADLLLPPGSESYDHYRTGDKLCCQLEAGSENFVHLRPKARHTHYHSVTTWPDGTVLTGPWIEVPS